LEAFLVSVFLLSEGEECFEWGFSFVVVGVDLDVFVVDTVGRVESNYAIGLNPPLLNDLIQHLLCIVKQLLCFFSHCLVLKDLRVASIWVLSSQLPCLEEWVPINIRDQLPQWVVLEYFSANELRSCEFDSVPVELVFLDSCFCEC